MLTAWFHVAFLRFVAKVCRHLPCFGDGDDDRDDDGYDEDDDDYDGDCPGEGDINGDMIIVVT